MHGGIRLVNQVVTHSEVTTCLCTSLVGPVADCVLHSLFADELWSFSLLELYSTI